MKPALTLLFNHSVPYRTQMIIPVKGFGGFYFHAIDQYFAKSTFDEDSCKFYPTIEQAIAAGKRWIDEDTENIRQKFPADYSDIYGEENTTSSLTPHQMDTKEIATSEELIAYLKITLAEARVDSLLPLIRDLNSALQDKGYRLSDFVDTLAHYIHLNQQNQDEAVFFLEEAAASLKGK